MAKYNVKGLLSDIENGVKALADEGAWDEFMVFAARFHRYSFSNMLLIYTRRPDATRVAGYKTWQAMGRNVKKGEAGLPILAPCPWKRTENVNGEEHEASGMWFKVVYVFDMAQTEGEDVPDIFPTIEGDDQQALLEQMVDTAVNRGLAVEWREVLSAEGRTDGSTIWLNASRPVNQQASVIVHELAHCVLEHAKHHGDIPRDRREWEAETVAYIVCKALGFDTERHSAGYLLAWAQGAADKVTENVKLHGERVMEAARTILADLDTIAA